jgi:hypothetical protein
LLQLLGQLGCLQGILGVVGVEVWEVLPHLVGHGQKLQVVLGERKGPLGVERGFLLSLVLFHPGRAQLAGQLVAGDAEVFEQSDEALVATHDFLDDPHVALFAFELLVLAVEDVVVLAWVQQVQ